MDTHTHSYMCVCVFQRTYTVEEDASLLLSLLLLWSISDLKDTVCAREQSLSRQELGHDAAHGPDVHWQGHYSYTRIYISI